MLSGLWSDGTGGIKGAKMGITQMAQRIKQIHPDYVLIFKVGAFCNFKNANNKTKERGKKNGTKKNAKKQ